MGEQQFICPECDHLDVVLGECPECGGTLQKWSPEAEMIEQDDLDDGFGLSNSKDLDDFDDEEGLEPHEGGLQVTF
jgi:hypothetical protein